MKINEVVDQVIHEKKSPIIRAAKQNAEVMGQYSGPANIMAGKNRQMDNLEINEKGTSKMTTFECIINVATYANNIFFLVSSGSIEHFQIQHSQDKTKDYSYNYLGSLGSEFTQIACGRAHLVALKTDHTVWGYGANDFSQLGGSASSEIYEKLTQLAIFPYVHDIYAFGNTTIIMTEKRLTFMGQPIGFQDDENITYPQQIEIPEQFQNERLAIVPVAFKPQDFDHRSFVMLKKINPDSQIRMMRESLNTFEKERKALRKDNDRLVRENLDLKKEKNEDEPEHINLKDDKTMMTMKKCLENTDREKLSFERQNESIKLNMKMIQDKLDDLIKSNQNLHRELKEDKKKKDRLYELILIEDDENKERKSSLEKQAIILQTKINSLQEMFNLNQKEISKIEAQNMEFEKALKQNDKKIVELTDLSDILGALLEDRLLYLKIKQLYIEQWDMLQKIDKISKQFSQLTHEYERSPGDHSGIIMEQFFKDKRNNILSLETQISSERMKEGRIDGQIINLLVDTIIKLCHSYAENLNFRIQLIGRCFEFSSRIFSEFENSTHSIFFNQVKLDEDLKGKIKKNQASYVKPKQSTN